MRDDDLERFSRAMATLAVAMDHDLTQERVEIYWDSLIDYPIVDVEVAFAEAIRTHLKFPKIKELAALASSAGKARHHAREKDHGNAPIRELTSSPRGLLPDPAWRDELARCFEELDRKFGTTFLKLLQGEQQ